jgi:serine/threonine-protein kinase
MTDGSDPRAQQRVGSVLDEKWTLEHLIGAGGMGAVYAARHRNGARAAVKILHPELARMPDVRERFLREGYAANRVEHRGVVQVLDDDVVKGGPDEGSAYLVMELLEGESLQERVLRRPKLTERELLEIMDAVLDVLAAAHEHGVIHRDLKPENIFLAKDPEREGVRVKVLDFGLARIADTSGVTNAGMAVGTPSFMSPEQAAGRSDEIDGRTDVFALGATIFRIVTGRRIHDADNMVQLVILMATNPAPPLKSVAPNVSDAFAKVVDRALTFERNDRPDANAMRMIVREALDEIDDDGGSLSILPFSARTFRAGSSADLSPKTSETAPRARAVTGADTMSYEHEAKRSDDRDAGPAKPSSDPPPSIRARKKTPAARAAPRGATLPWLLVLALFVVVAWKLGPALQEELVRRGSVWASAPAVVPTAAGAERASEAAGDDREPEAVDTGETASTTEPASDLDASAGPRLDIDEDEEEDAGCLAAEDDVPDASDLITAILEDVGAETGPVAPPQRAAEGKPAAVIAPRPHVKRPAPHTSKVPAKKPTRHSPRKRHR